MRFHLSTLLALMMSATLVRAAEPDLSEPKAAAKAFLSAFATGDAATMRASSIPNQSHETFIDAWAQMIGAIQKLHETAVKRYGESGSIFAQVVTELSAGIGKDVDQAAERIDGDEALLALRGSSQPLRIRHVDGKWKVDLSTVYGNVNPAMIERLGWITAAAGELSQQVADGKYADAKAAWKAFLAKLAELKKAATSRPTK